MSCPRCGTPIPVISFRQEALYKCKGCNARFKRQGASPTSVTIGQRQQQQRSGPIPLPPSMAKMTGCPSCGAPKPPEDQAITLNDGGSILCWRCGSSYHVCSNGESRTGFSPLTCPYCTIGGKPMAGGGRDPGDYLGGFYAGKVEKPKGDFVGDFCIDTAWQRL